MVYHVTPYETQLLFERNLFFEHVLSMAIDQTAAPLIGLWQKLTTEEAFKVNNTFFIHKTVLQHVKFDMVINTKGFQNLYAHTLFLASPHSLDLIIGL